MGKAGWMLATERVPHVPLADDATIEKVLFDEIFREWVQGPAEYGPMFHAASGWFGDVLELEVSHATDPDGELPSDLTFWFNESVDWARGLAEHWLRMAWASGRLRLDAELEKLGARAAPRRSLGGTDARHRAVPDRALESGRDPPRARRLRLARVGQPRVARDRHRRQHGYAQLRVAR